MSEIMIVTDTNLESVLAEDKPVIIAIGAQWCPDCRRAAPFYKQFAGVYADRALFASSNYDENKSVVEKFHVAHIPTMVVVKNGEEVDRIVEVRTPGELKAFIERNL